ncbi:MAG TPA: universal stress protein [Pusillimonas sp.]|uniref:universal stress protein n=1 Tax=Pusillimonas sp. TaxID=3040095 RepID=UPI002C6B0BA3|nr:universal stress protein [Pusillimonas sp.]HUH87524.1 universal stress protein [Pusillimonas sp.]
MNTVLVPIDGSESSLNALKAALAITEGRSGTSLRVITVQPPIASGNVKRFISAEILDEYYQEEGEKCLVGARELLARSTAKAEFEVVVGSVAESIVDYAQKHGCDHLVMGTRGLGRISGLLLGSVATKVLSLTDIPVTLVK